jgi:hypothetical protein
MLSDAFGQHPANVRLRHHARGCDGGVRERLAARVAMAKTTTPLTAQERVILFCTATGVSHAAVGITAHAMQSMAIKGTRKLKAKNRRYF